jgi:type II secretory pathway pseudopilin PulG
MEKMDERRKTGCAVTPVGLLVIILILAAGAALLLPALAASRRKQKDYFCILNLRCIAISVEMYEDRFKSYPPGESAQFYEDLRRGIPDIAQDGLFVCKIKGTKCGPDVCDYRGPSKALSKDMSRPTIMCSDHPCNHSPDGYVNVVFSDGHSDRAPYDSQMWLQADKETR